MSSPGKFSVICFFWASVEYRAEYSKVLLLAPACHWAYIWAPVVGFQYRQSWSPLGLWFPTLYSHQKRKKLKTIWHKSTKTNKKQMLVNVSLLLALFPLCRSLASMHTTFLCALMFSHLVPWFTLLCVLWVAELMLPMLGIHLALRLLLQCSFLRCTESRWVCSWKHRIKNETSLLMPSVLEQRPQLLGYDVLKSAWVQHCN